MDRTQPLSHFILAVWTKTAKMLIRETEIDLMWEFRIEAWEAKKVVERVLPEPITGLSFPALANGKRELRQSENPNKPDRTKLSEIFNKCFSIQ